MTSETDYVTGVDVDSRGDSAANEVRVVETERRCPGRARGGGGGGQSWPNQQAAHPPLETNIRLT